MTVLLDNPTTAPNTSAPPAPAGAAALSRPSLRRPLILLVLGCVVLAALSLLAPSAPTYDPWAWIIWGREILHLDLVTTTGPSWKPLPVLFTTAFAIFGGAAPALWLVVARGAALAAVGLAFLVGRRLGAGALAAGAAAIALATAPWWTSNAWMGNSEGLLVACLLGAVLAHLDDHPRAAFGLGLAAGLLRPEAWPFVGLYALWLLWRDRGQLKLVVGGLALLPVLWLAPEQWGSGNLFRASSRAQTDLPPGSPGASAHPAKTIELGFWHLVPTTVWIGVLIAALAAAVAAWRRERPWPVVALMVVTAAWVGLVAVMANAGYSGNTRYLIAPAALAVVLAGVGAGAVLALLPSVLRPLAAVGVVAALALSGAQDSLDMKHETLAQSRLPGDLRAAVARAGGAQHLRSCGPAYTNAFVVPQLAWILREHLEQVDYRPVRGSAVIVRSGVSPRAPVHPALGVFAGLPQRTLAVAPRWRIVVAGRCAR
ncbi:MAG: hypothetical protein JWM71_68 [Solirubrobacteraceae bacterium]|nr:hypothetical protein [Solirubrobacteraceae bacterium]